MYESPWTQASNSPSSSSSVFWAGSSCFLATTLTCSADGFLTGTTFLTYSSDSSDSSTTLAAFLFGTTLAFGLTYYSLYYSLSDSTFFLGTTAFWAGDLTAFLTGLTSYSLSYYELYSTTFFPLAAGLTTGDLAVFLVGLTSYSLSSLEDSCFLAGTVLVATLVATGFFWTGASSSELYSLEDYWTFFFGTTAFWTGDLALTTFLGASSSLSYEEDSTFLAFFETPFSVLTALVGLVETFWVYSSIEAFEAFLGALVALGLVTGVSSSSLDSCGWGFFLVYFLALTCSFFETIKGSGLDESSSESWE